MTAYKEKFWFSGPPQLMQLRKFFSSAGAGQISSLTVLMLVIRRLVDRHRSYTALFLKGESPKIFPTSDQEHARILQIYKQDRRHPDILNDFTDYDLTPPPTD